MFVVCVYTMHMPGIPQSQKKELEPLDLESQMFVSCRVEAENQTQVLCRSASAFNC